MTISGFLPAGARGAAPAFRWRPAVRFECHRLFIFGDYFGSLDLSRDAAAIFANLQELAMRRYRINAVSHD
jgi:hypothetical protein